MFGAKNPVTAQASAGVVDQDASRKANDAQFLNQSQNDCAQVFTDFLLASSPSARSEFVHKPIETAARMARFYELNPAVTIAPDSLFMAKWAVLRIGSEQAIEAQWMGEDGQSLDAVFRKVKPLVHQCGGHVRTQRGVMPCEMIGVGMGHERPWLRVPWIQP